MIFFHKYYIYNLFNNSIIDINNKDFSLLCISCFLLGTKSSETLIHIDDILKCIYKNNILKIEKNTMEYQKKTSAANPPTGGSPSPPCSSATPTTPSSDAMWC